MQNVTRPSHQTRLKSRHVPLISVNDDLDDVNGGGSAHFSIQLVLETLLMATLSLPLFKISLPGAERERQRTLGVGVEPLSRQVRRSRLERHGSFS
ncbi:hypothetical protein QQF64_031172 [Cirrhinus molitorella]|uniref:Uncharacterized protein n=1 Tax=Cirrhinus molitorella TaxID=172907 RepID=A0ABR3N5K4_9TELE